MRNTFEAKDLNIYKKLLQVLGDYTTNFPATGVDNYFEAVCEQGKKILPKDKFALNILHHVLKDASASAAVSKLLNMRFSNLPIECKPMTKNCKKKQVAFWTRNGYVGDKIKDLIDFEKTGKAGSWTDADGNKVEILDISTKENK